MSAFGVKADMQRSRVGRAKQPIRCASDGASGRSWRPCTNAEPASTALSTDRDLTVAGNRTVKNKAPWRAVGLYRLESCGQVGLVRVPV